MNPHTTTATTERVIYTYKQTQLSRKVTGNTDFMHIISPHSAIENFLLSKGGGEVRLGWDYPTWYQGFKSA